MSEEVTTIYEGENDRLKYLIILCEDEDLDTAMAASGALAILTSASKKCCEKVFETSRWLECFHILLANTNANLQYRGVSVVKHMIESSIEVAEKLIETDIMEILMALLKVDDPRMRDIKTVCQSALDAAEKWGIIKKPEDKN